MTAWLTDTLFYTGLLIALVLVARRPLAHHFGPQFSYSLWMLPVVRLLLPPIELPASMAPQQAHLSDQAMVALAMAAQAMPEPAPIPLWQRPELWLTLWLGGAAALLTWRVASYRRMRRDLLAEARPVGEVGRIRLVETPAVNSPVAFGVLDKVVALPPLFMAMEDRAARDLAIAHELAHHQGHDIAANFAAQPLLALHWFNPLAWLGWRAMRRDQEAACDARVIAGCGHDMRMAYAGLIAGFAAGPRLALAAPMACPMAGRFLGEKSIIYRLRSLSMSEVSPSRRRLGRWLLAGGALALPLTASVSYAAAPEVQPVSVPPSAAPAAPVPPAAPLAPEAPLPPAAPEAPPPPHATLEKRVVVLMDGDHAEDLGPGEHRKIVLRVDGSMSPAQRKQFDKMSREWEKKGAEWRARGEQWEKKAGEQQKFALAMAANVPDVSTDCDKAQGSVSRSWTDPSGKQHIVICERVIREQARRAEEQARMGERQALMSLRMARNNVAGNSVMSAAVRSEVLADLDKEITRLEAEHD